MAIPKNDFIEKPYNDKFLIYNYDEQRYVANANGITELTYVDTSKDFQNSLEVLQAYLDLSSRAVYTFMYKFIDASKYDVQFAYFLSHSRTIRQMIINIFVDTIWYNRRDGGFMMAYNSGANLNQGKKIDFTIDDATSSIIRQYISNSIMGNRIIPYNLNFMEYFDTLLELKTFLLDKTLITQEEFDKIENLYDIPDNPRFNCFMDKFGQKFVYEDLTSLTKIINSQWVVDNINGDW